MEVRHADLQNRIARACIGPSSTRGLPEGKLLAIRTFLKEKVDLELLGKSGEKRFDDAHSKIVENLESILMERDKTGAYYGISVKAVNLFLRDAVTNYYLRDYFKLAPLEAKLQIPVDSHIHHCLRKLSEGHAECLPSKWSGIKGLDYTTHKRYQKFAMKLAHKLNIIRVHLDDHCWPHDIS